MTEIEMPQHPWKQYLTERDIAYAEHDSMTQEIIDENSPLTRSSYNEK